MTLVAGRIDGDSGMTPGPQPFLDRLEGLAAELGRRGLRATVMTPSGRVPSLHVVNPKASRLAEDVYVGRSQDGQWWFWWSWAERIAPGDAVGQAAALVAHVLETADTSN